MPQLKSRYKRYVFSCRTGSRQRGQLNAIATLEILQGPTYASSNRAIDTLTSYQEMPDALKGANGGFLCQSAFPGTLLEDINAKMRY
jgi:hypothetical protein